MSYFTYVFPCVLEDHCKLGFSKDPLSRLQAFHQRWFEFFDLDRALLIEAETQRDARDLELELRRPLAACKAPMPLTIRKRAGGHTEWLRGSHALLVARAAQLQQRGHVVHAGARPWLARALGERADRLYGWMSAHFPDGVADDGPADDQARRLLVDVLDAYRALGVDTEPHVPVDIHCWYRAQTRDWEQRPQRMEALTLRADAPWSPGR